MVTIAQIYDWFMTGKKPTQAQFWASWGSFWNKLEQIPQSAIAGLTAVLNAKAEKAQFDAHKTDATAHAGLFDTKEDKTQKGIASGYAPLDDFIKIAAQYLSIVDDLVTGGSTSLLSAEQGKLLQTQVTAINTLLTSNDINLDTVQEIVDAIKTVETSLETILVNDLTTGGTMKALTAEMGKTLKGLIDGLTTNKVDKVAGERLINAAEITKLAGLGSLSTTVKPILSTALATQNVAGFVTYINALNPVLVVASNEIVKFQTTDTGRLFELKLRGRSFGVGQAAIVAADVTEVTEFLNKDIRLSNYPNTRTDGQLAVNKVLSVDAVGKIGLYSIAIAPAPYLDIIIPDSTLPSTTGNFILKGAFFTPTMTVAIVGQVVNYITFKSDNEVHVNVTTSAAEGLFAVTLDNGISATFANALLIVLGVINTPITAEWTLTEPINVEDNHVQVQTYKSVGYAKWSKIIDITIDWEISFRLKKTPFSNGSYNAGGSAPGIILRKISNNGIQVHYGFYTTTSAANYWGTTEIGNLAYSYLFGGGFVPDTYLGNGHVFSIRYIDGISYIYLNGVLKRTYALPFTENMFLEAKISEFDIFDIKYIELAT